MCLAIALMIASVVALVFVLARREVGHVFSNDPEVWSWASKLCVLLAVCYFLLAFFFTAIATLQATALPCGCTDPAMPSSSLQKAL